MQANRLAPAAVKFANEKRPKQKPEFNVEEKVPAFLIPKQTPAGGLALKYQEI